MSLLLAYLAVISALSSGVVALASGQTLPGLLREWISLASFSSEKRSDNESVARRRYENGLCNLVFLLLGLSGAAALLAGLIALLGQVILVDQLPFGLPWLRWHVRLDALSGFFMAIIGITVLAVSVYGPGYLRDSKHSLSLLGLTTGFFIAGMELV
ncbi:MAG: hydrogenase 4 subunit B, partial [Methylococcaceae bacterium]|nr:hydrogenase 4 subunit B [Methylococcaceae bacterium]